MTAHTMLVQGMLPWMPDEWIPGMVQTRVGEQESQEAPPEAAADDQSSGGRSYAEKVAIANRLRLEAIGAA